MASFQHGVDAIAACQEHVMSRNREGLLRELIRLKEILERMPNAFHTISMNPKSGENYVSPAEWVRWAKFSAPLSERCPATSGLQFPPYLVMDAFLGRKKYDSFLGAEGVHLRAWLPSNWRAFIAAIEYHYQIPEFVAKSGDPELIGALDGIVEAYAGERGFMGTHRYKVFGLLEVAGKTGRSETNGNSGKPDSNERPWEETHKAFSDAMKERLEPFRGHLKVEPHQMRGTFAECRYKSRISSRSFVDTDPDRTIARVTLDIQETGMTFQPGDRLAVMTLNNWTECAKVAAALGLDEMLDQPVALNSIWEGFAQHLGSVSGTRPPQLTVKDILRRGHLAPLGKELVMGLHSMLHASSNTVLQVLATTEWPVRGSLGDLLQAAVVETSSHLWDQAFDITGNLAWLAEMIPVEVPRTYSISNSPEELLPSHVDLTVSRSHFELSPILSDTESTVRHGVGSGFLNPPISSQEGESIAEDEELLIGVSRPLSFQLPIDDAAPCAFFAGGSGIAPFRSFWQHRAGRSVGKNILYLGVQSREKFCYESEIREYVNAGDLEVHTAFSRDNRGLVYDATRQDLIEKKIPPRYIDALIIEHGASVCDLVMSKKQGGLGGYLYVCGSVSVFESVMSGIRKAIYNHRTSSMESTDDIVDIAFAERRFMIDVFMTPKPLPCNAPTIPLSQLVMHTGHGEDSRIFIAVHGSVYDVTDFTFMHPGGTNIIKSNAGVDCSKSFDLLAHTNNPEVSSLLNKYFIGHLTPKPDFSHYEEIRVLYDSWADYLRTCVETYIAQQFEVHEFMDSAKLWFQGNLFNMGGVRRFYHHQSRLLQGGFSALFGAKLQELYLKLSFTMANATSNSNSSRIPDVLGSIARAKSSPDAMTTTTEISQIGQFTCDSEAARFHERGILEYVKRSVKLDIELLEGIREEACRGMDAFDSIMDLDAASDAQRITALSSFLLQLTERMAVRLEGFYSKLAQYSVYQPEIERNPARTRWNLIRRKIRDGSFFVLTRDMEIGFAAMPHGIHKQDSVEFDHVISQIQQSISRAPVQSLRPMDLTEQHVARGQATLGGVSAYEAHENGNAVRRMSSFMTTNMKAIRRLSKMPVTGFSLEQLMGTYGPRSSEQNHGHLPTPPSSRGSSQTHELRPTNPLPVGNLNRRARSVSVVGGLVESYPQSPARSRSSTANSTRFAQGSAISRLPTPFRATAAMPRPSISAFTTLPQLSNSMNRRKTADLISPARSAEENRPTMRSARTSVNSDTSISRRTRSMSGPLRALKMQETRAVPTF
ncbi:hypothetical protein VTL71DRAFT_4527 [Oculimacula yallundae]|uniref:NADPH--hemoprotein reductase n=1 Tax=Oculimacula yallundae TaxID=86028 RepID=A0ABR4C261_9HELO